MADCRAHIGKAEHNVEFLRKGMVSSKANSFLDWVVTVHFYAAVHYVEATLATENKHPSNHSDRYEYMCDSYPKKFNLECLTQYKTLQALSHKARYQPDEIKDDEAQKAQICLEDICLALGYTLK